LIDVKGCPTFGCGERDPIQAETQQAVSREKCPEPQLTARNISRGDDPLSAHRARAKKQSEFLRGVSAKFVAGKIAARKFRIENSKISYWGEAVLIAALVYGILELVLL
jgi:hypothetical protein